MSTARARGELEAWVDAFLRDPSFLEAYPYYAAILAKLTPVADPSVSRMAVSLHDGRFFLHLNVDAFMNEPQFLRGVLLHEVVRPLPDHRVEVLLDLQEDAKRDLPLIRRQAMSATVWIKVS